MAIAVYDVFGRLQWRRATLAEIKDEIGRRRRYYRTWDDRSGERWEYRGGEWRQTQAPDVEIVTGTYAGRDGPARDGKMAAAGEYIAEKPE